MGACRPIGAISTVAARVLLDLIRFFTNLFFFQTFSLAERSPAAQHAGRCGSSRCR
jgi:hypothetical protein